MTARQETSVSIALADVLDFERARIQREAAKAAQEKEEARLRAEQAARRAAEQAAQAKARAKQEAAEHAAAQAALLARQEREARFQVLVASRIAAIASQNERELSALREEHAARPRRTRPALLAFVTVAALCLAMAAVGCLVGSVLKEQTPGGPSPETTWQPRKARAVATQAASPPREPWPSAGALLLHLEANPDQPPKAPPELMVARVSARITRLPPKGTPPTRCALLGPLGCLNE